MLRRPIGGPAVMAEQLRHLVEVGESRRIRLLSCRSRSATTR
ncbi:Scr1 family TA system antitoxin-like transcriptional regulator [Streptomyces sp. NPDC001279]